MSAAQGSDTKWEREWLKLIWYLNVIVRNKQTNQKKISVLGTAVYSGFPVVCSWTGLSWGWRVTPISRQWLPAWSVWVRQLFICICGWLPVTPTLAVLVSMGLCWAPSTGDLWHLLMCPSAYGAAEPVCCSPVLVAVLDTEVWKWC